MTIAGGASKSLGDHGAMFLAQVKNTAGGFGGLNADCIHSAQKESQPAFPVPGITDGLQQVIIGLLVASEVVRQVKRRLLQDFFFGKQESNQQPANAPVAVPERMDGFKLGVDEPDFEQRRHIVLQAPKLLQFAQGVRRQIGRRHENGFVYGVA